MHNNNAKNLIYHLPFLPFLNLPSQNIRQCLVADLGEVVAYEIECWLMVFFNSKHRNYEIDYSSFFIVLLDATTSRSCSMFVGIKSIKRFVDFFLDQLVLMLFRCACLCRYFGAHTCL